MREAPGEQVAYTMKRIGFDSLEEYARWLEADARYYQQVTFAEQLRARRLARNTGPFMRLLTRFLTRLGIVQMPPGRESSG